MFFNSIKFENKVETQLVHVLNFDSAQGREKTTISINLLTIPTINEKKPLIIHLGYYIFH